MGLLTRLFGQIGTLRYEGETFDGRTFTGKCSIESIGMTKAEIEEYLKNAAWVEKGIRVKRLTITGFLET